MGINNTKDISASVQPAKATLFKPLKSNVLPKAPRPGIALPVTHREI